MHCGLGNRTTGAVDLKARRVLVTPTTFGLHDPHLRRMLEESVGEVRYNPSSRPLEARELRPLVGDVDGFIAGLDEIDASVIRAAPRLKVIARYGTGVDRVDLQAATRRDIVVTNTPGANCAAVAELTVGLMLVLGRGICRAAAAVRQGQWPRAAGVGLKGKTAGLVGFGRIGREVAARLRPFGCRVVVFDPAVGAADAARAGVERLELEELLRVSDLVSLHVPLEPATEGMVDERFLGRMRRGSFLVNTARGELVDEGALERALEQGRIQGAALDCLRREPPPAGHRLTAMPQVIVTPHMGAHTDEAMSAMGRAAVASCLAVLRGERPPHVVNPEVYGGAAGRDGA
jgi:phosphoglycerate dehydrogenase-like enzyme